MVRGRVKGVLGHLGPLNTARRVRDQIDTLRSLPFNFPYWYRGAQDGLPIPPTRLVRLATGTPPSPLGISRAARQRPQVLGRRWQLAMSKWSV